MPLGLGLATIAGSVGGFAWWPAALQIVLLYAAGAIACWWMLVRVFGSTPRILVPLTFYLFSPFLVPAVMWWAVAINVVAVQAFLFVLIGSHIEYLRTRRTRWLVIAGIALIFIAGFYAKSLIVTAVLGLFTASYATGPGHPGRRLLEAAKGWWRIWALYVAIGALVVWAYLREDSAGTSGSSGVPDFAGVFESLILRNLIPGLLGGPWSWVDLGGFPRQLSGAPDFAVAAALTVVVGAFAFAIHRWRNAWLPLIFLAPPVAVTFASVASLRSSRFSSLVGLEPRYWGDVLPYFVLALAVSVMAVPGLPLVRRRRNRAPLDVPPTAVAAIALAYVASSLASTLAYVSPWHTDFPARQFVTGAVGNAEAAGAPLTVANVSAPPNVVLGTLYPYNAPGHLFAPSPGLIDAVEAGVDLDILDAWGNPVPARPKADNDVDLVDTRCITGSGRIRLPYKTFDFPFWVTVTATFDASATVFVSAGTEGHTLRVPAGRHALTFRSRGRFDRIDLSIGGTTTACPEAVRIGSELEVAP
ncbi:hypothetical protein [Aeromicrobium sp. 179-A 4D2 NHS]|uniref:hypothetical protein n=1 Tax=Aeromicrobium sp. 179-A 4D2 NHS TaxID=3142375 RepID=UPI0039A0B7D6